MGIDDDFLRDVGQSLDKGGAAVGILVRKMTPDKVLEGLEPFREKGRVIHTSLSKDAEAKPARVRWTCRRRARIGRRRDRP